MIPALLWRCPLCAANDALTHTSRWLRPDRVQCQHCHARWDVRRAAGDNFYLKLISAPQPVERSITAWYDEMKKTLRLEAIAAPAGVLDDGESLYLQSQPAELWVEAEPGLDRPDQRRESEGIGALAGRGRLFLTDQRFLWVEDAVIARSETTKQSPHFPGDCFAKERLAMTSVSFPLRSVGGVYTILTVGIAVNCGPQLAFFRLPYESPLKWVTYVAQLAPKVEAITGRKLVTSHF